MTDQSKDWTGTDRVTEVHQQSRSVTIKVLDPISRRLYRAKINLADRKSGRDRFFEPPSIKDEV